MKTAIEGPTRDWPVTLREKWFYPIVEKIEAFEGTVQVFEDLENALTDAAPDWVAQCMSKCVLPYGETSGLAAAVNLDARKIGAHVGAKFSVCDAMERSHRMAVVWRTRDRRHWVKVFGEEAVIYAEGVWKRFAEVLCPEFDEVRSFAVALAARQELSEHLEFLMGITKGLTFITEVRKKMKVATSKAQKDLQLRMAVYAFAVDHWEVIEAHRSAITWMELTDAFDEYSNHSGIDEESFKKILQRIGLSIGTVGRPKIKKISGQ